MLWILGILFFIAMVWNWDKKQSKKNRYIEVHKRHLNNDYKYNEYLEWCGKNGEIPMNKKVYIKEIEDRKNKLQKLTK